MVRAQRSLTAVAIACTCACARADTAPESPSSSTLVAVDPATLRVTSGALTRVTATRFRVEHPSFRAELGETPRASVEVAFVYHGPGRQQAALASGELRRQIGLKLRARDACNVVYVMWHIEPSRGLEVSVKSNPGQSTHEECADRGYTFIKPSWSRTDLPAIELAVPRTLSATISGDTLRVSVDGQPAWVGVLPPQGFDGPVGVRSDNGVFDIELRALADRAVERPAR
jgi:hypothetical protein